MTGRCIVDHCLLLGANQIIGTTQLSFEIESKIAVYCCSLRYSLASRTITYSLLRH